MRFIIGPGDHLGQKTHKNKLQTNKHQKDSQQGQGCDNQRNVMEESQINSQKAREKSQRERIKSSFAKKMHGLGRIICQEFHGQKIKNDFECPTNAVFGLAKFTRPVVGDDFGNFGAVPRGQSRNKTMHLAVETYGGQALSFVSFHSAAVVVKFDFGNFADQAIG